MSAGLSGSSKFSRIALFSLLANGLLLIISFSTPYWTTNNQGHSGLWISCHSNTGCFEQYNQWVEGWVHATQLMMCMALTCWFFSTLTHVVYIFHRRFDEDKRLVFLSATTITLSALLTFLSVVTWASGQSYTSTEMLNWSYIFSCFVTVGNVFIFVILVTELRSVKTSYQPLAQKL